MRSGGVRRWLAGLIAVCLLLGSGLSGIAQEETPPEAQETPADPDSPTISEPPEPPYEAQLLRLSEILGSIHYLRRLCGAGEGNLWRDQMQALIAAENPSPIRRARLIDRFNRGYASYRSVYRSCTDAAALAVNRYMDEAAKITRDITARYGR